MELTDSIRAVLAFYSSLGKSKAYCKLKNSNGHIEENIYSCLQRATYDQLEGNIVAALFRYTIWADDVRSLIKSAIKAIDSYDTSDATGKLTLALNALGAFVDIQNMFDAQEGRTQFELPEYIFDEYQAFKKRDLCLCQNAHNKAGLSSVGIDGCRGGWIAVNITDDGFEVELYSSIDEICLKYADSGSLLVDMPIGLPESTGDIRPDSKARTYLSGRTSCIFNTPCRQAVYEDDYFRASQINKFYLGKGLSRQSFAICNRIREIDEFLEKKPEFRGKLRESHPEVCFAVLATKDDFYLPLYNSKHTEVGFWDRVEVLEEFYSKTREFVSYISFHSVLRKHRVDCIDALCLAVSGLLGIRNGFISIPDIPKKDVRGLSMEIAYGRKQLSRRLYNCEHTSD